MKYRFVVFANGRKKNFLKLHETKKGDLIISPRGKRHSVPSGSEDSKSKEVNEETATITNVTLHPNLKSEIGSLTINYKDSIGGIEERKIAGVLEVKKGIRLFPILTSIGRNIGVPHLDFDGKSSKDEQVIEIWPNAGINLANDSLAYSIIVGNPNIVFQFPEEFPRNIKALKFKYFQIIFVYWLYNKPTRFRGTTLTLSTESEYIKGFEFHEILNFTNDVTLVHSQLYPELPNI